MKTEVKIFPEGNIKKIEKPEGIELIDFTKRYDFSFLYEGNETRKYAFVTYFNEYGNREKIEKYEYVDANNIFSKVMDKENFKIDLSGCYINDISCFLEEYRKQNSNDNNKLVIDKLIAKDAFFAVENSNIFDRKIVFEEIIFKEIVDLSGATFNNEVSFREINFECEVNLKLIECMEDFNFKRIVFKSDLDISDAVFNKIFRFNNSYIEGKTYFMRSKFNDCTYFNQIEFSKINFCQASFKEKTYFKNNIKFNGEVDFTYINFEKLLEFNENVVFESNADFSRSKFKSTLCFFKTEFKYVDFRHCLFKGKVGFIDSHFKKDAKFWFGEFEGETLFRVSEFDRSIYFDDSQFKGKVYFYNTKIESQLGLERCDFYNYVDLRVKKCNYINLEESINRNTLDLRPRKNDEIEIEKINFTNIKNLGHIFIEWDKNEIKNLIENQSDDYQNMANQYRMLKENFRELGQYEYEDKAYVEFKKKDIRVESKKIITQIKNKKQKMNKDLKEIFDFVILLIKFIFSSVKFSINYIIQDLIGLYGTSPIRIAVFMLIVVSLFTFYYVSYFPSIDFTSIEQIIKSEYLIKSFYHSIITFLTIGYGSSSFSNIIVEGLNENIKLIIASGIEGFLGMFLMAYFTVAFVRKVLR